MVLNNIFLCISFGVIYLKLKNISSKSSI